MWTCAATGVRHLRNSLTSSQWEGDTGSSEPRTDLLELFSSAVPLFWLNGTYMSRDEQQRWSDYSYEYNRFNVFVTILIHCNI